MIRKLPAVVAVLGAAYLLVKGLASGPVMHSDSYEYFNAATLFAEGRALSTRDNSLLYFPPFYPIVLAIVTRVGFLSVERAAALLGAAVFGLNIYLAGYTVRRMTGSAGAALAASLVLMISARSRLDHAEALSDPLFTLLCQISLIGLIEFERQRSRGWLAAATGAAGLSMFTRFIGASTVMAAGLTLLTSTWRAEGSKTVRWREGALILVSCALSVVPCLAWITRNQALHGIWAGGDLLFAGDLSARASLAYLISDLGRYWSLSVNPTWWNGAITAVVVLVVLAGLPTQIRSGFERVRPHWIFLAVYAASLLASASVLDARWRSEYALPLFVVMNGLLVVGCRPLVARLTASAKASAFVREASADKSAVKKPDATTDPVPLAGPAAVGQFSVSERTVDKREVPQRQVRPSSSRDTPN